MLKNMRPSSALIGDSCARLYVMPSQLMWLMMRSQTWVLPRSRTSPS